MASSFTVRSNALEVDIGQFDRTTALRHLRAGNRTALRHDGFNDLLLGEVIAISSVRENHTGWLHGVNQAVGEGLGIPVRRASMVRKDQNTSGQIRVVGERIIETNFIHITCKEDALSSLSLDP